MGYIIIHRGREGLPVAPLPLRVAGYRLRRSTGRRTAGGFRLVGAHCKAAGMNQRESVLPRSEYGHPPLPAQEKAAVELVQELMERFRVPLANVLGHKEVPGAATACPGRHFSMAALRSRLEGALRSQPEGAQVKVYRVQVGSYKIRKNAENMAEKLKRAGFLPLSLRNYVFAHDIEQTFG